MADKYNNISKICQHPIHIEHNGKPCQCWDCNHIEGVCVSHESDSGCGVCEGPIPLGSCEYMFSGDEDDHLNPPILKGETNGV